MNKNIINKAKELMESQTKINKAPSWLLTELAVKKGQELAKEYGVDENLVVTSLYLAHTIFDPIWKGEIQKNHPELSGNFSKDKLKEWGCDESEIQIIINSIKSHHGKIKTTSKIAEVVKNAECYKFISIEGALIWLHELGLRGFDYQTSIDKMFKKFEQKDKILTFDKCKTDSTNNYKKLKELFNN